MNLFNNDDDSNFLAIVFLAMRGWNKQKSKSIIPYLSLIKKKVNFCLFIKWFYFKRFVYRRQRQLNNSSKKLKSYPEVIKQWKIQISLKSFIFIFILLLAWVQVHVMMNHYLCFYATNNNNYDYFEKWRLISKLFIYNIFHPFSHISLTKNTCKW